MKTTLLAVMVLVGSACAAQVGVITLKKRAKEVPIGQWYTIAGKDCKNNVFYHAEHSIVLEKLNEILEQEGLFFEEYQTDEAGDKYWYAEKENSFPSYIYLVLDPDGYSTITIYTESPI